MANKSTVHRFEVNGKKITIRQPYLFGKPASEKYVLKRLPSSIDLKDVRRIK